MSTTDGLIFLLLFCEPAYISMHPLYELAIAALLVNLSIPLP